MSIPRPVNYPLLRFNLSFDQPGQFQLDIEGITQFLQQYQLHQNPGFKTIRCKYSDCRVLDCSYGHSNAIMAAIKAIREQNSPLSSPHIIYYYSVPILIPADGRPVTFLPIHPSQPYPVTYFPPPPPYPESPQLTRTASDDTKKLENETWGEIEQALNPSAWTLSQETQELNDQTWEDIEQSLNELRD